MDATTFRYLIGLTAMKGLDMQLMDVVTAYLYGSLDKEIYMKVPEGYASSKDFKNGRRDVYSVRLQRSLYGLKQSGRMWYNRLSEFLLHQGFMNNEICPCIFIRARKAGFAIIAVYVDDLNIIGSPDQLAEISVSLTKTFEMKDLGKTKFCLGLQVDHLRDGILLHQSTYTTNLLKGFLMDKCHPLTTPMVVRSLDVHKDLFRPLEEGEEVLGPEFPYLSAIGALLNLANCTRPDIAFSVNLLARHSAAPTVRHWTGIKHLLRYLQGTIDLGLFYERGAASKLIGYADAGYLSDPHRAKSQSGYVYTYGGTAISWKSVKQSLTATSSNHAELLAMHEASKECVWLRDVIYHIQTSTGIQAEELEPTTIFEDNAACIAQLRGGYIKGDKTKHISPKFFATHELQEKKVVDIRQIRSCDNLGDLFTKSLPTCTFRKLVNGIGMKRLKDLSP